MKLRLGLILLLFAASAGILAWMYYAATREPRSPKGSPWAETLADLDACCRRKHVKSVQYDHFAGIAADEERHTAERLFRAMAFSERLQENNCATAILHLGGHYTPPGKIIIFGGTTDGNLERSVAYERQAHAGRSGADIRRAMERGNRYAARILTWASAGDMRNIALLERCRRTTRRSTLRRSSIFLSARTDPSTTTPPTGQTTSRTKSARGYGIPFRAELPMFGPGSR